MLIKSYVVLENLVVEVSCIHGIDPTASHLVYRAETRLVRGDGLDVVMATAELMAGCASLCYRGEIEMTCECGL